MCNNYLRLIYIQNSIHSRICVFIFLWLDQVVWYLWYGDRLPIPWHFDHRVYWQADHCCQPTMVACQRDRLRTRRLLPHRTPNHGSYRAAMHFSRSTHRCWSISCSSRLAHLVNQLDLVAAIPLPLSSFRAASMWLLTPSSDGSRYLCCASRLAAVVKLVASSKRQCLRSPCPHPRSWSSYCHLANIATSKPHPSIAWLILQPIYYLFYQRNKQKRRVDLVFKVIFRKKTSKSLENF